MKEKRANCYLLVMEQRGPTKNFWKVHFHLNKHYETSKISQGEGELSFLVQAKHLSLAFSREDG